MTALAPSPSAPLTASTVAHSRAPRWTPWITGLVLIGLLSAGLTVWGVWSGSRSDYYASIALSMSKSWSNLFFGAFDPAGTVTLDKIPGSFWIPALFVRLFGFSTFTVILPNALAAVAATLITAVTARRLAGTTAGLLAGAVVAVTPVLVAVSRSNQPETFFVLGLALTAWAAARALKHQSFWWLMAAGGFIALSFQTYMLEAWAVWPALAAAYLCTAQPVLRKLWHTAVAGATSLAASVLWIVIVALIPAGSRPYIGSTLHNDPWEMVFGYNGLGRFGSSTADATAYNSFTPPFSGSAGIFRLFNEQVAGQIAWMIPASILAVAVLGMLRFRLSVTVFLGVWIATFLAMFSAVAGMHQFYTAALAVPMGLAVGLAFGWARSRRVPWAQMALIAIAAVTALVIGFSYGGYSIVAASVQLVLAAAAIAMIAWETRRVAMIRTWTALVATGGMLLTPAVWSAVTIANPSSTNPVAGGVADMGGFGRQAPGSLGGGQGGPQAGGQASGGFGGQAGGPGGAGQAPGGQGGFRGQGSAAQAPNGGRFGGGVTGADSTALLTYLKANAGDAKYLVAVFGAQTAAGLIIESDGGSVLPIGGFSGNDPVPTLAEFQVMVAAGDVKYVLTSGRGGGFGGGGGTGASSEIMSWVEANCTSVTDASVSGLYQCSASSAGS